MKLKKLLCGLLLIASQAGNAQTTDPMIINWWFNTTGNMYHSILTDVEAVYYNTANVYVKTSGVPNYYVDGASVNNAVDLNATWVIPRIPTVATTPTGVMGGQQGLMLDGSVFFHPGDARSYMNANVWNQLAYYFEGVDMDVSNGHSTPTNMYHHHFDNLKLHGWDSTQHSPIVGYAWDGYPVYGPYGYKNADGTGGIKRITSSYTTKSYTTRTSGPAVSTTYPIGCYIEDWQYTTGAGDLDAHNGRMCKTPEYPGGTYAYFTTVDASLKPYYPYFVGPTFYGVIISSNAGPTGGHETVPSGTTTYTPPPASASDIAKIEANVSLFPVPVTDILTVQLTDNSTYTVVVYNVTGAILQTHTITATAKIDMSQLAYGVYFIEVTDKQNGSGFIKRIVKQ